MPHVSKSGEELMVRTEPNTVLPLTAVPCLKSTLQSYELALIAVAGSLISNQPFTSNAAG